MASAQYARCTHELPATTRLMVERLDNDGNVFRVIAFMCEACQEVVKEKMIPILSELTIGTPVNEDGKVDKTFHLMMNVQNVAFELAMHANDEGVDVTKDMPVH